MSIEFCTKCPCRFAVGLACCPQCGALAPGFAARQRRAEENMPRITVAGGPSNAQAQPGEVGYVPPEGADTAPADGVRRLVDAGYEPEEVAAVVGLPDGGDLDAAGVNEHADGPADGGAAAEVPHADKPVADLKAELRDRGLPVSGSKADLVQRLIEHDQAQADAEATAGD